MIDTHRPVRCNCGERMDCLFCWSEHQACASGGPVFHHRVDQVDDSDVPDECP